MFHIKDFLAKFSNLLSSEEAKRDFIKKALLEVVNLEIELKDISIKNDIITINTKPAYKSEIFLKKEKILEKLKEFLGNKAPTDIR